MQPRRGPVSRILHRRPLTRRTKAPGGTGRTWNGSRMRLAVIGAAGLALVHAVPARARGAQQELCHLITSARHVLGPEIAAMERTTDPSRRQVLHRKISVDAPPFMARLNVFMGKGYRFTNYTGTVTDISPDGNPARGPVGIDVLVLLNCAESPAAVSMRFPLIGAPGTRSAPLGPTESSLERFKPVLAGLRRGSRVAFSGTIFPYREVEYGIRLLYRNMTIRFDARITRFRKI